MRRWLWVLAGLLLATIATLAFAPASLVLGRVQARVPGLELSLVSGTIWRGGIGDISYRGRSLGAVNWHVRASELLRLRALAEVEANGDWGVGRGVLWRDSHGLGIEAVHAEVAAAPFAGIAATPELELLGAIGIDIASAELHDGALTALTGEMAWHDAAVAGVAHANLGTLRAHLALDAPNAVSAVLSDDGGPLAVDGGAWLSPLGYSADVRLRARDPALRPVMRWLGQPQADGQRRLQLQGTWLGAAP